MPRFIYSLLIYLIALFAPLKLLWRGLRQPAYFRHWGERYGIYSRTLYSGTLAPAPLIWLHCVSVGETRAAAPLVAELQTRYPQHRILITHATPTGRDTGTQLFGDSVLRAYLPYDTPDAVRRFLAHFRPQLGLLLETELWFNLIAACRKRAIPLLLVNARLSQKSAHGYLQISRLAIPGIASLRFIGAQTEQDAERLKALGASRISVLGNLKFDVTPPPNAALLGENLRRQFGDHRPVLLAASTREGEEALILQALALADIPDLLTVIVPRHPQRFDEVVSLLKKQRIPFKRRSTFTHNDDAQISKIILGDSMGEMFSYYAACDVALIGGSLLPFGGQNLIEACAMSKPVLTGQHTYNFALATEMAIGARAAWRVNSTEDLAAALKRLFSDQETRLAMGRAALDFSIREGGATRRTADLISQYLPTTAEK